MKWLDLSLFAVAGVTGNVALMMAVGFIRGPNDAWLSATVAALLNVSVLTTLAFILRMERQDDGKTH